MRLAKGLFYAAAVYGDAERLEDVERLLVHIRVLAGQFPEDAAVAAQLAFGLLVGAVSANGSGGDVAELASLLENFGDSEAFRPVLALLEQLGQQMAAETRLTRPTNVDLVTTVRRGPSGSVTYHGCPIWTHGCMSTRSSPSSSRRFWTLCCSTMSVVVWRS